jgi:nucleotidyltransferase/DNA polymerase involved in DNA repair
MQTNRYIAHVDMDAFFAAIEQRDNPLYKGKPVIVGADHKFGRGRGVVSTCSYEARKFGIHSAMPISIAYRKCPQAIFLPVDMKKYSRVSRKIYNIFNQFTPYVEAVSIDEAFLDLTGSFHLFGTPFSACKLIKEKIKNEIKLTASVGLAPTKMAAKIASELSKPDGLLEVTKEKLLDFLWPLPVEKIHGLGKKAKETLNYISIFTIGQLAKSSKEQLVSLFGKNGEYFFDLANGKDEREVQVDSEVKSIGSETTFDQDTLNKELINATIISLSENVSHGLRSSRIKAKTITLKVRLEGFETHTKAITLGKATNFVEDLSRTSRKLFESFIEVETTAKKKRIRLLGIKASNFIPLEVKDSLFDCSLDEKKENVHQAIEKIRHKFGSRSILRAAANNC